MEATCKAAALTESQEVILRAMTLIQLLSNGGGGGDWQEERREDLARWPCLRLQLQKRRGCHRVWQGCIGRGRGLGLCWCL